MLNMMYLTISVFFFLLFAFKTLLFNLCVLVEILYFLLFEFKTLLFNVYVY
jgi:hypothetical protein